MHRVIHDGILSIDDEDALGNAVSPDERMKCALLRDERCQPVGLQEGWRRTRAGAGAGPWNRRWRWRDLGHHCNGIVHMLATVKK